jgi:beta-lactamase class A
MRWLVALGLLLGLCACGGSSTRPTATSGSAPSASPTKTVPATASPVPRATASATSAPSPTTAASPPAAASPVVVVPSTPVGDQLAWALEMLNSAARDLTAEVMQQRFTSQFLAAAPPAQTIPALRQFASGSGPFTLESFQSPPTDTSAVALLRGAGGAGFVLSIEVEAAAPHLISGLLVQPDTATSATPTPLTGWGDLDARLRALAPQVNVLAAELTDTGCAPVHALDADHELALGSAFKLYVLGELGEQVRQGTASWDEQLAIRDDLKSLPSGKMQDEPVGTQHTLREYAEQMISISDNTAADHLLARLGRTNVEAFQAELGHSAPELNEPFLSTREMFALKLALTPEQRAAYVAATPAERRQLLTSLVDPATPTLAQASGWTTPRDIESIEWFASASDLCRALAQLHTLSQQPGLEPLSAILAINPGIPFNTRVWPYAGFKGGSEPGVLNLSWLLQRADGRWFVLTAGLNDPNHPLDENAAVQLMQSAADLLAQTP